MLAVLAVAVGGVDSACVSMPGCVVAGLSVQGLFQLPRAEQLYLRSRRAGSIKLFSCGTDQKGVNGIKKH